jgi:hypothetical protein
VITNISYNFFSRDVLRRQFDLNGRRLLNEILDARGYEVIERVQLLAHETLLSKICSDNSPHALLGNVLTDILLLGLGRVV